MAIIMSLLAGCFGVVIGMMAMSTQVEEYKKEKKEAEAALRTVTDKAKFDIEYVKQKHRSEIDKLEEELVNTNRVQGQKEVNEYKKERVDKSGWREVARWQGSGMKNTETFHVSADTWRISWQTKPTQHSMPIFQIYVYKSKDKLGEDIPVTIAANVMADSDSSSSTIRGSGDYYLVINTLLSYVVMVEEKI